ncbi:hypothetical protein [Solemya velum gill symbiont]|uniref:hypothetical protein n=1 Tax=Solemya velum gill symbiont TaxID=2340 RepID=UPI0009984E38|nr:hypothetical protein [Solemya velum gill symbiont]OOZ43118.1 hypothetical protein BOW37_12310 [Solemya velum gill symbiont]OOZ43891.1 hypothetical protein BOW38_12155 [Solemya velum gill symbiont]OOZ47708.1 hypothetical protein BOW39_12905 [Solemya velum gill symbiont]OOZ48872.1 hypothetical protein BOW40_12320 [Solemya velum gill symbiont]OOZ52831.1 hypothetical protein BOW41_12280 [Solemya velum gill symbiont]
MLELFEKISNYINSRRSEVVLYKEHTSATIVTIAAGWNDDGTLYVDRYWIDRNPSGDAEFSDHESGFIVDEVYAKQAATILRSHGKITEDNVQAVAAWLEQSGIPVKWKMSWSSS